MIKYDDGTLFLYPLKKREHAFRVATLIESTLGVEVVVVRKIGEHTRRPGLAMYLSAQDKVIDDLMLDEARKIVLAHPGD